MPELIIHAGNAHQFLSPEIDGEKKARGLVPRNFAACPHGSMPEAPAFDIPVIPQSEWAQRCADQLAQGRRNSDFRRKGKFGQPIPSLDQNGKGYCWAHGTTGAVLVQRAVTNMPFVSLSAYAVACIIKNYQDQGGWCGESLAFLTKNGVPDEKFWPQRSMSKANDTAEMRANALLHKVTEGFYDLGQPIYDQKLTFDQAATCHLLNVPTAEDFNWWGHSVCCLDLVNGATQRGISRAESGKLLGLVEFDAVWDMNNPVTSGFGTRILNSWGDTFGDMGEAVLTGSKCIPDNAVGVRVSIGGGE